MNQKELKERIEYLQKQLMAVHQLRDLHLSGPGGKDVVKEFEYDDRIKNMKNELDLLYEKLKWS